MSLFFTIHVRLIHPHSNSPVRSVHPLSESVTLQVIRSGFRPLKLTFRHVSVLVVAQHGMDVMCLGVWQKDGGWCSDGD